MKVFIMAILLCQMDLTGYFYYTPMVESPRTEYSTMEECLSAASIKRQTMLESAKRYPDLEIFDVQIKCQSDMKSKEDWHPGDKNIPI